MARDKKIAGTLPANTVNGLAAMNASKPLVQHDPKTVVKDIIARYMDGEKMSEIAPTYGLKGAEQLYRLLCAHAEDEWKSAQASKSLAEYERAKDRLETAQDGLSLARAREQIKTAQWELERVLRRIYGQEAPNQLGSGTVHINISLDRNAVDEKDITPK